MESLIIPVPVSEVVPHQGSMVLLRNVIAHGADGTVCDLEIHSQSLFLQEGGVPSWVALEYIAQAVAAHGGMVTRAAGGKPEVGFLIGARRVDFFVPHLMKGSRLHVAVHRTWGDEELFSFQGTLRDATTDKVLAQTQLNLFKPKNLSSFLEGKSA
jgi:predicted hotdog family 3-hydroxylacyl-ACP dehydratase